MAKKVKDPKFKSILTKEDLAFLEAYINNPSPTGFEAEGQKLWQQIVRVEITNQCRVSMA